MSLPVSGPETVDEFVVHLDAGTLVCEVLKFPNGATRLRLGHGTGSGVLLTVANIASLRLVLARSLELMAAAERRAA